MHARRSLAGALGLQSYELTKIVTHHVRASFSRAVRTALSCGSRVATLRLAQGQNEVILSRNGEAGLRGFLLTLYHAKQLATLAQWSADWQSARDETISNCKCGPPQRLAGKDFKMLASLLHDKGVEIDSAAYSKIRYRVRDKGGESDTGEGLHVWVHTLEDWFWYDITGHAPY